MHKPLQEDSVPGLVPREMVPGRQLGLWDRKPTYWVRLGNIHQQPRASMFPRAQLPTSRVGKLQGALITLKGATL